MLRCFIFVICIFITSLSLVAKEFDLAFRYYDAEGMANALVALNVKTKGFEIKKLQGAEPEAWQTWRIINKDNLGNLELLMIGQKDSLSLSIQFHPESLKQITTLILPRLQAGVLKYTVSKYSCKWQGGIASPLDLSLINRLDGKYLELKEAICADSLLSSIYINGVSDSLLLVFDINNAETYGFKYYLSSNNELRLFSTFRGELPAPSVNAWWLVLETQRPLNIIYLNSGVIIYNERCQLLFEDINQIKLIRD